MNDEEARLEAARLLVKLHRSLLERKLEVFCRATAHGRDGGAYDWQKSLFTAGKNYRQRAVIAANRVGKTFSVAAEVSMHLTGKYPQWWEGHRFTGPIDAIVAGTTNQDVRDIQQQEILGTIEEGKRPSGRGWVPADCIGTCLFRQCGVSNVVDTVKVKHVSGEWSSVSFKSFEQGPIAYQGVSRHLIWMDEEPENDPNNEIFSEVLMRLMTLNGIFLFTRTPLFGRTAIVEHFLNSTAKGVWHVNVGWDSAKHLTQAQRDEFLASVPRHQRETRSRGVPMMGSGGVYELGDAEIECEPFPIPSHYRRICGIDFGIDHPAAGAWLAHDADSDVVYVYDAYKMSGQTAAYHADAIMSRGDWIPVAWPHDGMIRDKGGGVALAEQYRAKRVNMLGFSARYDDDKAGAQAREPVTLAILERMRTGRFKVFRNLDQVFSELRMLHRKDGKIVPVNDDIESAVRYGMMMLRCALSGTEANTPRPSRISAEEQAYDPLSEFSHV